MLTLDALLSDISGRLSRICPMESVNRNPLDYVKRMTLKYRCPADIRNDWAVVLYCYKCKCHNALMAEEIWSELEKEGYAPAVANMDYVRNFTLRQNRIKLGAFLRTPIKGNADTEALRKKLLAQYENGTASPDDVVLPPFPNLSSGGNLDVGAQGCYTGPYTYAEERQVLSHDRTKVIYLTNMVEYRMMACQSQIILADCKATMICAPVPSNIRYITDMLDDEFYAFGTGRHVKWSPSDRYVAINLIEGDYLVLAPADGLYARVSPRNKSLEADSFRMMDDGLWVSVGSASASDEIIPVRMMGWHDIPRIVRQDIPGMESAGAAPGRHAPAPGAPASDRHAPAPGAPASDRPASGRPASAGRRAPEAGYDTKGMKWVRNRHKPISRSQLVLSLAAAALFIAAILLKVLS